MALARAAVADGDDILAPLDVVRACQFQHQHFVQRWQRQEVEAVEAFDGREPCRLDPALHHASLTIDHLHLGQRPFDHGEQNLEIEAEEEDSAVERYRPLIIVEDEDTTKDRSKKRAKNRRDRAAGNALKASIRVQGFRDDTGQLWEPGNLVWTESPFLDIAQDMLIEQVAAFVAPDPGQLDFSIPDNSGLVTLI